MSDPQNEQLELLPTVKERAKLEAWAVLNRHGLISQEGKIDVFAIADLVYPTISKAVVDAPGDRANVGVTPTQLVAEHFPEVPGPQHWTEHEDPEFQEELYKEMKSNVFRVLSVQPDGLVQMRLGTNGGLVLCRTASRGGREEMAYVTRNRKCIDEDNNGPALKKAHLAMERAAALSALSIDRVPEHGKWFERQYNSGVKQAVDAGKTKIRGALTAGADDVFDDEQDGEGTGDE
jgi:hypothetical protein